MIWFQNADGTWPADKPPVVGYAVSHYELNDGETLYSRADAEAIAATLDGARVFGVVGATEELSPEATASYWEDIAAGASPRDALASARDVEDIRDVPTERETDDSAGREFSDA